MSDFLHKVEAEIAAKQAAIAELQASLAELETTVRVYKRLQGAVAAMNGARPTPVQPSPVAPVRPKPAGTDQKKTARDLAIEILAERGPMHYREIADEAVRRGYHSLQSDDPTAPQRTFMSMLYRAPKIFESAGKGMFKLKK